MTFFDQRFLFFYWDWHRAMPLYCEQASWLRVLDYFWSFNMLIGNLMNTLPSLCQVAVVLEDKEFVDSYMDCRPWQAGKFAHSLRMSLWAEHLGLAQSEVLIFVCFFIVLVFWKVPCVQQVLTHSNIHLIFVPCKFVRGNAKLMNEWPLHGPCIVLSWQTVCCMDFFGTLLKAENLWMPSYLNYADQYVDGPGMWDNL